MIAGVVFTPPPATVFYSFNIFRIDILKNYNLRKILPGVYSNSLFFETKPFSNTFENQPEESEGYTPMTEIKPHEFQFSLGKVTYLILRVSVSSFG